MGKQFTALTDEHRDFIGRQHVFFVATAPAAGRVNLSPKGRDSLRVLSERRVVWLNLTGSGNETAAHVRADPRMTLMFCAFEEPPLILRLYGQARARHRDDPEWAGLVELFPSLPGARQIFDLDIDLVQTSCGFGVPLMDFKADRETLVKWAGRKGTAGIRNYWAERNVRSLDGRPTGMEDVLGNRE